MATSEPTSVRPFFQPRPEHDNLQTAYLLWKMAGSLAVDSVTGCWLWLASKDQKGYGKVGVSNKDWLVHRLVYELCVEHVPITVLICHNCPGGDNPSCCNPKHLYAGSHSDNMRDAVERGNHYLPCAKGGKKARKLTDDAVRDIRRRVAAANGAEGIGCRLAEEYGVSAVLISNVIHRRRYASVPDQSPEDAT